jgi:hypothetical protein
VSKEELHEILSAVGGFEFSPHVFLQLTGSIRNSPDFLTELDEELLQGQSFGQPEKPNERICP